MKVMRAIAFGMVGAAFLSAGASVLGQVVINEIVKEERTAGAGAVSPDAREFIELYNAGNTTVNIENWSLFAQVMSTGATIQDFLPSGASIDPGGYYVIAVDGRDVMDANHYISIGSADELYPDLLNLVIELRNAANSTVDAVGFDTFRAPQTASHSATQLAQTGNGIWGQAQSYNITETANFKRLSIARFEDGRDTDVNGRDFGFLPVTQGASNNLPQNPVHTVPDVSALGHGANVPDYNYGFIPVRAINPGTADSINPSAITDSPRNEGRVMIMWDESGGGNSAYSKELVNKFDIYAYLDTTPLAITSTDWEAEFTAYGIGTTDPLFGTPNSSGLITTGTTLPVLTQNSSTGIGWLYTRMQRHPNDGGGDVFKLQLVDFGEGGNSVPDGTNTTWTIIEEFDLVGTVTGWHHLGIDYDPITGEGVATFGENTVPFTTATDILGTFYVGYREALSALPGANFSRARPATFDLFVDAAGLLGDFNEDGMVDARDYLTWRKNTSNAALPNDDGLTTQAARYNLWVTNYGMPNPGGGSASGAVPEPASAALVLFGLIGASTARRRNRRA